MHALQQLLRYPRRAWNSQARPADYEYENLDLVISPVPGGYTVRITNSPQDWTAVEHFSLQPLPRSGEDLFQFLFSKEILACFRTSLAEVGKRGGLRVRLFLNEMAELAELPWECLEDPARRHPLVLSKNISIVRCVELPEPIPALKVSGPLRILVVISNPRGPTELAAEQEVAQLSTELADLVLRERVLLTIKYNLSACDLQDLLDKDTFHVFHFIGHGFLDRGGDGALIFENSEGSQVISCSQFSTLLGNHNVLRLVILNACETSSFSRAAPWRGLAQNLLLQNIPAVVAMQREISDAGAIAFSRGFYRSLAVTGNVDCAVSAGRRSVHLLGQENMEWCIPTLWMRSKDGGHIFSVEANDRSRGVRLLVLVAMAVLAMIAMTVLRNCPRDHSCESVQVSGIVIDLKSGTKSFRELQGAIELSRGDLDGLEQLVGRAVLDGEQAEDCTCQWSVRIDGANETALPAQGGCDFIVNLPEEFSSIGLKIAVEGNARGVFRLNVRD